MADTNKSIIFALYINGYGERYYIVQAQDVRPIAQMEEGAGMENPQFLYREQDESGSPRLQKSLLVMSMSPIFSSTLPLHR